MACSFSSIVALSTGCFRGIDAGIQQIWMISYNDLNAINTGTTEVYSASTSAGTIVTSVGLDSGKKFVEIGLVKDASAMTEKLTKDLSKGVSYYTQSFTLRLNDLSVENHQFIYSIQNQPVAIIYKSKQGKYFIIGLNGQLEVSNIEGGTGQQSADGSGHNITIEGTSSTVAPFLLDTVVASLIA